MNSSGNCNKIQYKVVEMATSSDSLFVSVSRVEAAKGINPPFACDSAGLSGRSYTCQFRGGCR